MQLRSLDISSYLIDMKTLLESQKHDAKHENTRLKNEVKNIKNYPKYVQDAEHELKEVEVKK